MGRAGETSEELAQTLEKIVSQLDIITKSLHVLEQRVSLNEESVGTIMSFFKDYQEKQENDRNISSHQI